MRLDEVDLAVGEPGARDALDVRPRRRLTEQVGVEVTRRLGGVGSVDRHVQDAGDAERAGHVCEGTAMAVTGLANLAVKVADLDAAIAYYERAGANVVGRGPWNGGERVDVHLGPVQLTLFTRAIYEDAVDLPAEGFLHPALFTDDLDRELVGHEVIWGPEVVSGPTFGTRRIAFVAAPGGIRLEFMEQLA
jgi:catechol 2,3-dioxygenase-like lactoylglutathione lyase family enzyme